MERGMARSISRRDIAVVGVVVWPRGGCVWWLGFWRWFCLVVSLVLGSRGCF